MSPQAPRRLTVSGSDRAGLQPHPCPTPPSLTSPPGSTENTSLGPAAPAPRDAQLRAGRGQEGLDISLSIEHSHQVPANDHSSSPQHLTDPSTIRALSHAVRLALIEVLGVHGALTATQAGELIGESATTCSFHLRQLAKYGFVEEAGKGPGRSRPWRVKQVGWIVEEIANDTEQNAAAKILGEIALERQLQRHQEFNHRKHEYPVEWRDAGDESHTVWWVTPSEMASLQQEINNLIYRFRERLENPELRPAGVLPVEVMVLTHLFTPPDIVAQSHEQDKD